MPKFDPRRAEPEQEFDYNDADGQVVHLRADKEGVVRPKDAAQQRAADAFGLPVARTVAAAERRAEEQEAKRAEREARKAEKAAEQEAKAEAEAAEKAATAGEEQA